MRQFFGLLFTLLFSSSLQAQTSWILGGFTEPKGSPAARAVVALVDRDRVEYCAGVLIAPRWILTAAHCVLNEPEIYLKNAGRVFGRVTLRQIHPNYAGEAKQWGVLPSWDLALVSFSGKLPTDMRIAALVQAQTPLILGQSLLLSGYGHGSNSTESPDTTNLQVFQILPKANAIILRTMSDHGICYGDSGGPAYRLIGQQILVYGIASHFVGEPTVDCSDNILYTDLRRLRDWITRHLRR